VLLTLVLLSLPALATAREVGFTELYFVVNGETTNEAKQGEVIFVYVTVANNSKRRVEIVVEDYTVDNYGNKSEKGSATDTVAANSKLRQVYTYRLTGPGSVKFCYELYTTNRTSPVSKVSKVLKVN